ncbi:vacuolar protein-sorting protein VPS13 [Acrasis kona]|uniref:Vacuolar protein-sorting protein VPS13 n=1 Tax=Acrasis kona TaxID=1008807 RepID=A0AAW2YXJ5_9EUKA
MNAIEHDCIQMKSMDDGDQTLSIVNLKIDYESCDDSARTAVIYSPLWIADHTHQQLSIGQSIHKHPRLHLKSHRVAFNHNQQQPLPVDSFQECTLVYDVESFETTMNHYRVIPYQTDLVNKISIKLNDSSQSEIFSIDENDYPEYVTCTQSNPPRRYDVGVYVERANVPFDQKTTIVTLSARYVIKNQITWSNHVIINQTYQIKYDEMMDYYHEHLNQDSARVTISLIDSSDNTVWTSVGSALLDNMGDRLHKVSDGVGHRQVLLSAKRYKGSIIMTLSDAKGVAPFVICNEMLNVDVRLRQVKQDRTWVCGRDSEMEYGWDDESGSDSLEIGAIVMASTNNKLGEVHHIYGLPVVITSPIAPHVEQHKGSPPPQIHQEHSDVDEITNDDDDEYDDDHHDDDSHKEQPSIQYEMPLPSGSMALVIVESLQEGTRRVTIKDLDPSMNHPQPPPQESTDNVPTQTEPLDDDEHYMMGISATLPKLVVSLVDDKKQFEALRFSFVEAIFDYKSTQGYQYLDMSLGGISILNKVPDTAFKRLFYCKRRRKQALMSLHARKSCNQNVIPYFTLSLLPFYTSIDTSLMEYLSSVYDSIYSSIPLDQDKVIREGTSLMGVDPIANQKSLEKEQEKKPNNTYVFDELRIDPVKSWITVRFDKKPTPGGLIPRNIFIRALTRVRATIDTAPVNLSAFERDRISTETLFDQMSDHYTRQLLGEMYKILGSLDVIGNPVGLVREVTKGFRQAMRRDGSTKGGLRLGTKTALRGSKNSASSIINTFRKKKTEELENPPK